MKTMNFILPQIITKAGNIAKSHFKSKEFGVSLKEDQSYLTDADLAVQNFIIGKLQKFYPNIPIIAEEDKLDGTILSESQFTWIIDPIDGTSSFVGDTANWVTAIGLLEYGIPCAGWVYSPMTEQLYSAPLGDNRSYVNDEILSVLDEDRELQKSDSITITTRTLHYYNLHHVGRTYSHGSNLLHFCLTSSGNCIACLSANNKVWDICPAFEISKRAGCCIKYIDGSSIDFLEILSREDKTMKKDVLVCKQQMWDRVKQVFLPL